MKLRLRVFLLTVVLLFTLVAGLMADNAQEGTTQELNRDRFPEALGFQYGLISGAGLSYQRWFGPTGLQVAGGILYFPAQTATSYPFVLDYSIGLQVNRSVFASDYSDRVSGQLYLVGGVSHGGRIDRDYETSNAGPFVPSIGLGGGLGIEIVLFEHFSFPIEVLYAGVWEGIDRPFNEQIRIDLVPQTGFRYRY
ncbi:MAG: hypothetical protein EA383_05020 [Spirochaetaceae bacterium]|nr:MAG: hypothetical protein EA383_05020 [Spirochaetaceae bacterium]